MRYLKREDILQIHSAIIDETGGLHGIRDYHSILSVENSSKQKVFGKELYPTIFLKAAIYARDIIMNHPFLDGNKRTGTTAASVFIEDNGYKITAKEGEIEKLALTIIKEKLSPEKIASWFEKNSQKIKYDRS